MNQATQVAPSVAELATGPGLPANRPLSRWTATALAVLLLWIYLPTLLKLVSQWWHDPNFSHGFFVPLFSAFVLWENRKSLLALSPKPSWGGLIVLAAGLFTVVVGILGAELFLSRLSLLLVIAGLLIYFFGWSYMRAVFFPWAFLLLMIPLPSIVFNQITLPLQLLASRCASFALPLLGVPVLRQGNVIVLPAMALEVAEACSGIRSLLSLITLAIIYGYFLEKRMWVRVVLALAAIPLAIVANSLRIVGTGLLVQYWDPSKAEGFFHAFSGWLIFVVSLLMLYLLHRFIERFLPGKEQAP